MLVRVKNSLGAVIPFLPIILFNLIAPAKIDTQRKLSWLFSLLDKSLVYGLCQ